MKVLTSKKAIITILSLGGVVLAGTIKDINSRTVNKKHALMESTPAERNLASDFEGDDRKIAIMHVGLNEAFKIDGQWEITRIIGADEVVTFDKLNHPEDAKKTIKVPLKLVNTSIVRVNNDLGLEYNISLFSNFGTMAVFKKIGDGFEILELRKIKTAGPEVAVQSDEVELVLERALNQAKSPKVLTGSEIEGSMTLTKNSIEGLSAALTNANGEVQNIEIASAQLMDGGSFKADVDGEEVSGVVFNNGKDGYRLSFVTGPLAGAMLNFVTKEELAKIEDKGNEVSADDDSYEKQVAENEAIQSEPIQAEPAQIATAQNQAIEERREIASDVENAEPVEILSAEQIRETAETQGFGF